MKHSVNAAKPGAKQSPTKTPSADIYYKHDPETDLDEAPLLRQMPGFLAPNCPDETQGPGMRSIQDYKK